MEKIKLQINDKAEKIINKIKIDKGQQYVDQWKTELNKKCYILGTKNKIYAFALLHKTDYDPFKKHIIPNVLDFIYTLPKYRRKGCALKLLLYLKNKNEITAICNSEMSEKLFQKAKFKSRPFHINGDIVAIYRYP